MDDKIFLQELKLKLKTFELEFMKKNKRKATKDDISSDKEINDVYRSYWSILKKKEKSPMQVNDNNEKDIWKTTTSSPSSIHLHVPKTRSSPLVNFTKKLWSNSNDSNISKNFRPYPAKQIPESTFPIQDSLVTTHSSVKPRSPTSSTLPSLPEACQLKSSLEEAKPINNLIHVEDQGLAHLFTKKKSFVKMKSSFSSIKKINLYTGSSCIESEPKFIKNIDIKWLNSCEDLSDNNESSLVDTSQHIEESRDFSSCTEVSDDIEETENNSKNVFRDVAIKNYGLSLVNSTSMSSRSADFDVNHSKDTTKSEDVYEKSIAELETSNSNISDCAERSTFTNVDTENNISTCKLNLVLKMNPMIGSSDLARNTDISNSSNVDTYITEKIDQVPEDARKSVLKKRPAEDPSQSVFDMLGQCSQKSNKKPRTKSFSNDDESNLSLKPMVPVIRKPTSSTPKSTCTSKTNGNFIKLNLRKKMFSRGSSKRNLPHKYKMAKWKKRQNGGNCFKCGQPGHWANKCKSKQDGDEDEQLVSENVDIDLPTETMESQEENKSESTESTTCNSGNSSETREDSHFSCQPIFAKSTINSLYTEESSKDITSAPPEVLAGLKKMGHKKFRDFQEKAVMRVLCGLSTLLVLPTGSGKSLCYQLPAYLYATDQQCITIVISPLVSLMEDQVKGLPKFLQSVFLHSGMTAKQREKSIELVKAGSVKVLLISPEFMLSSHRYMISFLPQVAFVCIDEAHCLSEWSHNFRPSYLQLVKVIKEKMGVNCILALTATATKQTINQIKEQLGLVNDDSFIGEISIPENLNLSVSCDNNKDEALLQLLSGERFMNGSVIIYCTRREETERLATLIRIRILDDSYKGNKKTSSKECAEVSAYHAGLSPSQRRTIQKMFMSDKMKIVVATVAFGMGLNKSDVRGIIHYNMPKSFESYVQEVGRAGRDDLPAHCHLFLNSEGSDLVELRRYIYGDSVERHTVRKLLNHVFKSCSCIQTCSGHHGSLPVDDLVQELDLRQENISTLLCYLELNSEKWLELYPSTFSLCTIRCYQGRTQLDRISKLCEPVAVGRKLAMTNSGKDHLNSVKFNYVDVASLKNWNPFLVRKALKELEFANTGGQTHRSGVIVEFSDLSFHFKRRGDYSGEEKDKMLNLLYGKVVTLEKRQLSQLGNIFNTFKRHSERDVTKCLSECNKHQSDCIKNIILEYFHDENPDQSLDSNFIGPVENVQVDRLRYDIRSLLSIHHEKNFTGRQVAQIFYGISSPKFPAEVWGRARTFWRAHLDWEFNKIVSVANEEIIAFRI